jgi:hypothetical protein
MQMPPIDLGRDAVNHINVTVTVRTRHITRWRLQLGMQLFKFAGWITGFQSTTVDFRS